jgi:hypothetical protein
MISLTLGLVAFVAWFFSMLAGGGSPLVLIPLVNLLLGSQAVAPVITTGMLVGNAQRTFLFWQEVDWQVTLWYLPGAIAGAVLGAYVFTQIHWEGLQLIIGVVLLLMVLNFWFGKKEYTFTTRRWHFLPAAFFNAIGSALIGSTGPIMNPMYLNYGLVKENMIATKSFHKVVLHIVKLIAYLSLGAISKPFLFYGLLIGFASLPANWLAKQVLARMTAEQFRHAAFAFIAFSGVFMLWQQRGLLF